MKTKAKLALAISALGLLSVGIVSSRKHATASSRDEEAAPPGIRSVESRARGSGGPDSQRNTADLKYKWQNYAADPSGEAHDEKVHEYLRTINSESEFLEAVDFIGSLGFGKRRDQFMMSVFSNRSVPISLLFSESRRFTAPGEAILIQHAITSSLQKRDLTDFALGDIKLSPVEMETFAGGLGIAASSKKPFSGQSSEEARANFEQGLMALKQIGAQSGDESTLNLGKLHYLYSSGGADFARTLEEFENVKIPNSQANTQASVKLVAMLAQSQPEKVITFLSSSPNHSGESDLVRIAVDTWSRTDLDAAANWVDTSYEGLSPSHKDQVAMAMAAAYKRIGDNHTAKEWAAVIQDAKLRGVAQSQNNR